VLSNIYIFEERFGLLVVNFQCVLDNDTVEYNDDDEDFDDDDV